MAEVFEVGCKQILDFPRLTRRKYVCWMPGSYVVVQMACFENDNFDVSATPEYLDRDDALAECDNMNELDLFCTSRGFTNGMASEYEVWHIVDDVRLFETFGSYNRAYSALVDYAGSRDGRYLHESGYDFATTCAFA